MNKRAVKEILVGLALGIFVGGLMIGGTLIKGNSIMVLFNGPVFLLAASLHSFLIYCILSLVYWAYLGVMFVILIDLKKTKLLLFIIVLLVVLHLIVLNSLQGAFS